MIYKQNPKTLNKKTTLLTYNMTNKKRITVTIDQEIYIKAKNICYWDNRSLSNLVETAILYYDYTYYREGRPNKEEQSK